MASSAADPNTDPDGHAGSLADAAARLDSALARLEALVDAGPLQSELFRAHPGDGPSGADARLRAELDAASGSLGRAIVQVREVLGGDVDEGDTDAPRLDLATPTADDAPA